MATAARCLRRPRWPQGPARRGRRPPPRSSNALSCEPPIQLCVLLEDELGCSTKLVLRRRQQIRHGGPRQLFRLQAEALGAFLQAVGLRARVPDIMDVLEEEEGWVAAQTGRTPRTRAELAPLVDDSVMREALGRR
jgi:hypothetical protein